MSKHTPGPWLKSASGPTVYALHSYSLRNRFSAHCQAGRQDDANAEELEANACLMAAAPDLLKALHGLLDPATYEDGEWYRQARQAARDAIAKAEGQ
jgi:hypothetical protein